MARKELLKEEQLNRIMTLLKEIYQRAKGQFYVKEKLESPVDISNLETTKHYNDRRGRVSKISNQVGDIGDAVYSFIVDTGHPNGDEVHTITEKGLIVIQNKESGKLITILAARPGQIKRYWISLGIPFPKKDETFNLILRYAQNYQNTRLNYA